MCLKSQKINTYLTRFAFVLQEMHNKTKISTPLLNIQRSKDIIQVFHDTRDGDTNLSLAILAILGKS
jgi:hypothetical protein